MLALFFLLAADILAADTTALAADARAAEVAFAQTFAERKLDAFVSFVSEDAVFVGKQVSRGKAGVRESWKKLFEGPAPFSWRPETVEVTASGTLALSQGPVFDPQGKRVGTYNSTWRREKEGWRIVLDIGCPTCAAP